MDIILRSLFNVLINKLHGERVLIVIDPSTGVTIPEFIRTARPISSKIIINGVVTASKPFEKGSLENFTPCPFDSVIVLSDQNELISSVQQECKHLKLKCIDSCYPPHPSQASALIQEAAHHDYEIGGLNEWDGNPTMYPEYFLQLLSQKHCKIHFPDFLLPYMDRIKKEKAITKLDCLDVGCGPVSRLRWGAIEGFLNITGLDPLIDMYQIILEKHGYSHLNNIRCSRMLNIRAEELSRHITPESFDIAFSCNSIDHTEDPPLVIEQIGACLRKGGVFGFQSFVREGTRQKWENLHQFDIYLNANLNLVCETQDGFVRPLITDNSRLKLKDIVASTETSMKVVFEKPD